MRGSSRPNGISLRDHHRPLSNVTVGFAGIGRMGLAMARNLLATGFPLVVWNRTAERCIPLVDAGAGAAAEARSLAAAEVIVTMVSDGRAARSVLLESGLLDELRPGSVVLEMSTIGPAAAAELAAEAARRDVHLLDAPVSGSVSLAEAGQLFAMVGGDREAYARVAPVLDAMTKGHVLLGPSGAGAAMKLAVNAMIAVTNESLAETLALAERFGIARERAYDVLAGGALASPFVLYKRGAFLNPDTEPVAFTTALMRKDLSLAQDLAAGLGVRLPAAAAAADMLDEALRNGLANADMASVMGLLDLTTSRTPLPTTSDDFTEEL
jgi:3-hydroxyisobutyrate dehydrogenase-like beta-hydroxyacid dehydrogenase